MEIICPSCKSLNRLHNRICPACKTPLAIRMETQFWVEDRSMSLETLFLEVRLLKEDREKLLQQIAQQQKKHDQQYRNLQDRLEQLEQSLYQSVRALENKMANVQERPPLAKEVFPPEHLSDLPRTEKKAPDLVVPPVPQEDEKQPPQTEKLKQLLEQEEAKKRAEEAAKLEEEREQLRRLQSVQRQLILPREEQVTDLIRREIPKVQEEEEDDLYVPPAVREREQQEIQQQQAVSIPPSKQTQPPPRRTAPPAPPTEMPAFLVEFFAPLSNAFQYIQTKYEEFKAQQKLPLFFLTLAGITALLFGVGLLVRYSANTWFGELSTPVKSAIGFTFTALVMGLGLYLIHKDKAYRGFGSALTGLGISLNYLFIYFLAITIPSHWGFVLIFANTAIAIGLALRYSTKIIALLSLVAGGMSPLYLESTGQGTLAYFGYLWILCAASVFIAKRIQWELLIAVALLLSGTIAGMAIYIDVSRLSDVMHLSLHHAFAYLFTYAALFDGLRLKGKLGALHIMILLGAQVAIVSSLSYLLGYYHPHYNWLSVCYFINSLPFIALLATAMKRLDNGTVSLMLALIGGYWVFGVAAVAQVDYYGIFWGIEGLLFLACGFALRLPFARRVGYLILGGGFAMMLFAARRIVLDWQLYLSAQGISSLAAMGLFLGALYGIIRYFDANAEDFERKIRRFSTEAISFWLLTLVEILVLYYVPKWSGQAAAVVAVLTIARADKFQLPVSYALGLIAFLGAMVGVGGLAIADLSQLWGIALFHAGYFNLISMGLWIGGLMGLLYRLNTQKEQPKQHTAAVMVVLEHLLAVWGTAFFFVSAGFGLQEYALNLAIIPLFGLLYWGNKRGKPGIEAWGAIHLLPLFAAVFISAEATGTFRFSQQFWYGRLGVIEILAVLWSVKFFYQYLLAPSNRVEATSIARELSYLIIALIPFNITFSEAYDYVAYGAWASVVLSFLLADYVRKISLVVELHLLALLATFFTLGELKYGAMPVGAAVLLGIFFYRKGYEQTTYAQSPYKYLFSFTFYYIGIAIVVAYWGLVSRIHISIPAVAGLYLLVLAQAKDKIFALESSAKVAYRLGWLAVFMAMVGFGMLQYQHYQGQGQAFLLVFFALSVGAIFAQVYVIRNLYPSQDDTLWRVDLVGGHLLLTLCYFDVLYQLTGDPLNLLLTIVMVLHGVALVLHTLRPRYRALLGAYIALLVLAVGKLFFWDMRNAAAIHRILAFIGVGVIFLVAAFFFVRYTKNNPITATSIPPARDTNTDDTTNN